MAPRVRSLIPFLHVRDLAGSIAFSPKLGFEVANSFTPPDRLPSRSMRPAASAGAPIRTATP